MKRIVRSLVVVIMACLAGVMAGCGGGGGGGDSSADTVSQARLTLSVSAPPAGTLIGGVQGKITLPAGYSVGTVATGETAPGVFSASGNAASSLTSAGFAGATRVVTYALVQASGFSGGDFATLLLTAPAGASVNAADFVLSENLVVDTAGNVLNLAITVR